MIRLPVSAKTHAAVVAERDEARALGSRLYFKTVELRREIAELRAELSKIHTHRDSGGRFAKVQS